MGALLAPPAQTREQAVERALSGARVIGSPGLVDEAGVAERSGTSFDRSHDPAGVGRQLVAIVASGDRTEQLRSVTVPTLVIHGAADPLVAPSGGEATAAAIPAELWLVPGWARPAAALWPSWSTGSPGTSAGTKPRRLAEHSPRAAGDAPGQALEGPLERGVRLDAREVHPDADVRAGGERQVAAGVDAVEVEHVRVGEGLRVAVGGGDRDPDEVAGADRRAADSTSAVA